METASSFHHSPFARSYGLRKPSRLLRHARTASAPPHAPPPTPMMSYTARKYSARLRGFEPPPRASERHSIERMEFGASRRPPAPREALRGSLERDSGAASPSIQEGLARVKEALLRHEKSAARGAQLSGVRGPEVGRAAPWAENGLGLSLSGARAWASQYVRTRLSGASGAPARVSDAFDWRRELSGTSHKHLFEAVRTKASFGAEGLSGIVKMDVGFTGTG